VSGSYTGSISNVNFGIPVAGAPGINLNDSYQVDYAYDTAAPFHSSASGTTLDGVNFNAKTYVGGKFTVTVGAYHFSFDQSYVVATDFPAAAAYADHLGLWSCVDCFGKAATSDIPGWNVDTVYFDAFFDPATFSGTDLPATALDPALDWNDTLQITLKRGGDEYYLFGANQPLVATTPIPASAGLFLTALGAGGLAAWSRRRRA
jgi:hypothetical protein